MADRDENGRFVKGNKAANGNGGGPGRPPKKREERYLEITLSAVTYEDWKAIVKKAAQQAARGDSQARKWLSDYLIGPPVQRNENKNTHDGEVRIRYIDDWRGHKPTKGT